MAASNSIESVMKTEEVKAMTGLTKHAEFLREAADHQRAKAAQRWTADRWLDENEREWYAMDRMICSRPWAEKKDTPFKYTFREATEQMREAEGKFMGDNHERFASTRSDWGLCPVITQALVPPEFPPAHRVLLFTPEFGSDTSFNMEQWNYLEPQDKVDLWVVCWQGWTVFDDMIKQVTQHVLSFGDGANTVWFGQGMGAIIAYEVLKRIENENIQTSTLPVALVVSDCPAPHLFAGTYKPYNAEGWADKVKELDKVQQDVVNADVGMMLFYDFSKHNESRKLLIPIVACCHESADINFADPDNVKEWEEYAKEGEFELVEVGEAEEFDTYMDGKGYAYEVDPTVLGSISEMYTKHNRWNVDRVNPDIGPTDTAIPEMSDIAIVGCGISGIYMGSFLSKRGKSIIMFERYHAIGGVWQFYANNYSRVNTSEVGYRIRDRVTKDTIWGRVNEDHTPRHDILQDIFTLAHDHLYGKIRLNMDVYKVTKLADEKYEVKARNVKDGSEHKTIAKVVSFFVNRRIGKRRDVNYENAENFRGKILYGYGNDVKDKDFWDKTVVIVGAGAFAFENVRTVFEHGARYVTLLGRRDGTTCPKWIDMIAFLRPLDPFYNVNKAGSMISFEAWQNVYNDAGLQTPQCWREGLLKPHNHTISVSDICYIAGYHGCFTIKTGEIAKCRDDGLGVDLKDGRTIDVNIIIRCTGFHLNDEVTKITGYQKMQPYGLLDYNLNYMAEPLLDGGQFGSAKGSSAVNTQFNVSEQDFLMGVEKFKRLGFDDKHVQGTANPFGSGQGGPIHQQSLFFNYLIDNPDVQKAMLNKGGEAPQEVVNLWNSQIGVNMNISIVRLIAALASVEIVA